jgi:hypothetical protein
MVAFVRSRSAAQSVWTSRLTHLTEKALTTVEALFPAEGLMPFEKRFAVLVCHRR